MPTTTEEPRYVYGVLKASTAGRLEGTGIGERPLEVIRLEGLGALTSTVGAEPLEAGREELLAHAHALEQAFERGAVLPMRFGIVMDDEDSVRSELLAAHREELEAQLEAMEGKVEINIRGVYDEPAILREVVGEDPEVATLREAIASGPEDATYPERIRLGELVAETLQAKREADSEQIVDELAGHAVAVDVGEPVHERMAVSASFLVERGQLAEFDRALEQLAERQGGRILFKYTGPLPPHSFVELSLEG